MISWCAWCQKFLREISPYDDYSITHGMCSECEKRADDLNEHQDLVSANRRIYSFFKEIHQAVKNREFPKAKQLIREAADLGLDDRSFVFGILQPTLYNVGLMWETGLIDVAQEHQYTRLVERTLELLSEKSGHVDDYRDASRPTVLLTCVNGNFHTVGLKMLEYYLAISKIPVSVITPGLPARELVDAIQKMKPRLVGLSISLAPQLSVLGEIKKALDERLVSLPEIYVGGYPIRNGVYLPEALGMREAPELEGFVKIARICQGEKNG